MKLIMAISWDCFLARDEKDDMSWTGPVDKLLFQALTMTGPGVLFAGRKTYDLMPQTLRGRFLYPISRDGVSFTLEEAYELEPNAWLIGGRTIAMAALEAEMISEVFLIQNQHHLQDGISGGPLINEVSKPKWASNVFGHGNLKVWHYRLFGQEAYALKKP